MLAQVSAGQRVRSGADAETESRCSPALIEQLDLVITVDTLAAHLAGALGKPAWVLLQHAADWRWMADRDDSPWYPSLKLYRQGANGDWEAPMEQVTRALHSMGGTRVPHGNGRLMGMTATQALSKAWDGYDAYLFDIDGTSS